jgi:hypothetical protein
MTTRSAAWTELRIRALAEDHPLVLTDGVGPFLRRCRIRGHFIPDPDKDCINVYVNGPRYDNMDGLRASIIGLLRERGLESRVADVQATAGARTSIHHVQLAGTAAQDLIDDFLCDTSTFVLRLIDLTRGEAHARARISFEMMAIQPFVLQRHLFARMRQLRFPCTFISYRSHVDGFLMAARDPHATRAAFDERFERTAPQIKRAVEGLHRQVLGKGPVVSVPAGDWGRFLDRHVGPVLQGLLAGKLAVTRDREEEGRHLGDRLALTVSPFHQAVYHDRALRAAAPMDHEFNGMRIMASLLYLTLHRTGVRLIERYLLCYLVSRCFEEIFAVTPAEAVAEFARLLVNQDSVVTEERR